MQLLKLGSIAAGILAALVLGQWVTDFFRWDLPWYAIQELCAGAIPMIWLLRQVYPKLDVGDKNAFLVTSALFLTVASIFELIAIQNRYWWFYQDVDRLTGLMMGDIPLEEFVYYPILLNIPVLLYVFVQDLVPKTTAAEELSARLRKFLIISSWVLIASGVVLLLTSFFINDPPLDLYIEPIRDDGGAIRYTAGPAKRGWTIVQLLAAGGAIRAYMALRHRICGPAMLLMLALYFPYAFFIELMACGRGWWVWNSNQTSGIFTWVLPLDSYVMYVTGAILPVAAYEYLRTFFAGMNERGGGGTTSP